MNATTTCSIPLLTRESSTTRLRKTCYRKRSSPFGDMHPRTLLKQVPSTVGFLPSCIIEQLTTYAKCVDKFPSEKYLYGILKVMSVLPLLIPGRRSGREKSKHRYVRH